jgi:hypothetical protein
VKGAALVGVWVGGVGRRSGEGGEGEEEGERAN